MTPTNLAAALIAARIAQAQIAVAARLMRHPEGSDAAVVQQLVAAATLNGEKLAAAVQRGIGELVDFTA
jgi:hypothetical protein